MIDSVLKGTGNSRFLKSAVPAGTSWADALAMLQAGTFPIDFNGINAEGFQQVGTPLNKANLLKDATAAQIGLPPSTTPDGMFQALGNTGELHVWKKTITSGTGTTTTYPVSTNPNAYQEGDDAKPAGYTLGEVVTGSFQMAEGYPSNNVIYETANSISVGADGAIILNSPVNVSFNSDGFPSAASFLGKFIRFSHRGASGSTMPPATTPPFNTTPSEVVYIPTNATITHTNGIHAVDRYQPVTGYAAIPAGTTIEYLGRLGGKTRVQVLFYVGTGTYGSDHKNSLTFDFVPKIVMIRCGGDGKLFDAFYGMRYVFTETSADYYVIVKWSKKTLSWYSDDDARYQMNDAGAKYYAIAID